MKVALAVTANCGRLNETLTKIESNAKRPESHQLVYPPDRKVRVYDAERDVVSTPTFLALNAQSPPNRTPAFPLLWLLKLVLQLLQAPLQTRLLSTN